jgi:hypothetical protein
VTRKAEPLSRSAYVEAVLRLYRNAPGLLGHVRRADLELARELHRRGVPLQLVDDAITVACCRRVIRAGPPLEHVRTLHYFLPVLAELAAGELDPDYVSYLRLALQRFLKKNGPD